MKYLKVYLEDDLLDAVKQSAGDVPVSAWFRALALSRLMWNQNEKSQEVLNGTKKLSEHVESEKRTMGPNRAVEASGYAEAPDEGPTPKPLRGKTCVHGTPKGHHCWQCGGLAQV